MINPQHAHDSIAKCKLHAEVEVLPIEHAMRRTLAEDLFADHDLPPFHRVMMDGIAVAYSAIEAGVTMFALEGIQRAGATQQSLLNERNALEVMTGAVCPAGTDTVIPYEHVTIENGIAHVHQLPEKAGKHIHPRGSDKRSGDRLVSAGAQLGPAEIGIAASIGKVHLSVRKHPRVLICSTGDELVPIHEMPQPHQIRRSNVYALQGMLNGLGILSALLHVPDERTTMITALESALKSHDIILFSGGVSKGKFDLLPDVMDALGVECLFHRIAQKPGKPMWFGHNTRCTVFAFPGNPVSTMVCAARYLLPWLKREMNITQAVTEVTIEQSLQPHATLTLFEPVRIIAANTGISGLLLPHHGSGDFSALAGADGIIEIPAGGPKTETGSRFRYYPFT
jgi:molybdopterin molybdotransferase